MAKSHRPNSIPPELDFAGIDKLLPSGFEVTDIINPLLQEETPDTIDLRDNWSEDDINGKPLATVADASSITNEATPPKYINLTRSPITLDGITYDPRPVRFQPVWDLLGQHSTLMGYSAEADSLPYIDDNTIAILPRGVPSLGLLEYIERAIVIDQECGRVDARAELEKMRYIFPKEPIQAPPSDRIIIHRRFVGGAFTIQIEDGPDLTPVEQSAYIAKDGHAVLPLLDVNSQQNYVILIVPNDGRIIDACQGAYPHCYVAVLDEPTPGQRTRLFLVRGPRTVEKAAPQPARKPQLTARAHELNQRCDALEMQISMLLQREDERNAFILGLSNTVDNLQASIANLLDLQHPASSGVDQLLGTREDVKQHSKRLHSLENSQQSLSELIRHTMTDMSRIEGRLERKFNAPTGSIPITNQSFSDDLLAQVHKLIDDLLPEFKKIQKAADESKRQWMRNINGVEGWLFHIHDQTIVVVDIDGNLIDSDTGYDWKLIDGPTPATLPAANGPEGD